MTLDRLAFVDVICERLIDGQSLRKICASPDMPDRKTVMNWMEIDPEFAAKCARARVLQADAIEEDMADIEQRTLDGEIDPAAARAVLASKQWRASKLSPKKFGDKIEVTGSLDLATRLAAARERASAEE